MAAICVALAVWVYIKHDGCSGYHTSELLAGSKGINPIVIPTYSPAQIKRLINYATR